MRPEFFETVASPTAADDSGITKVSIANNSCVCFRLKVALTDGEDDTATAQPDETPAGHLIFGATALLAHLHKVPWTAAMPSHLKEMRATLVKFCPELLNVPRPHLADKKNKYMTLGRAEGACTGVGDRERLRERAR